MMTGKGHRPKHIRKAAVRLGYLPLNDCAPLVMTQELVIAEAFRADIFHAANRMVRTRNQSAK